MRWKTKFKCTKCGSRDIKARVNYPFGRKSKGYTTYQCKRCRGLEMTYVGRR